MDWERVSPPAEWKPFSLPERLCLKTVRYGGVGGQSAYDVSFAYDALRFEDLRIGFHPLAGRDWVSRRINAVTTTNDFWDFKRRSRV
ncbi:Hypothetical protein A7982_06664 [Minicystis rosea]|nr:Hypothetical protein A7982_06664 [Minicystis rosea]